MASLDSSWRSKSWGEKGHSGGYCGALSTFSASSFIEDAESRLLLAKVRVRPAGVNPDARESCLMARRASSWGRMVVYLIAYF